MKWSNNNIFNPPAIIVQAPDKKPVSATQQQTHIEFEDKLRNQLFYGVIKNRGKDGRTYNYVDNNGEYVSSFLSPYNYRILDNVEPHVKTLVGTLINKGYLTASSCQGHPEDDVLNRWVIIAFISEEERTNFIDIVNSFNLPVYWYFNFLDFQEEPKLPENRDGYTISVNMKDVTYKSIEDLRNSKYSKKDLTDFWNIMFSRNYNEYFPVQMCICSCPGDITLRKRIKTFLQWPFRDFYTRRLVTCLQNIKTYNW
jgi:hypothetical protein